MSETPHQSPPPDPGHDHGYAHGQAHGQAHDNGVWSEKHRSPEPDPTLGYGTGSGWATGGAVFSGVLMVVSGILGILNGIAGIAKDDVYTHIGDYTYAFSLTAWGWIHLILGIIVTIVGYGILTAADWARGAGIAIASLYVVAYFMFLPYAPVWSVIAIGIGVFVIWSLASDSSRVRARG